MKTLSSNNEKIRAHELRHRVFSKELGWVKSENLLEIDNYDRNTIFFGVLDEDRSLLAFLRLILPHNSFMLEKEFALLIDSEYTLRKKRDTVEVSRLCVLPEARNKRLTNNFGIQPITMFLYKGVYHWCMRNSVRYLYLVVEHKIYRLLRAKGFPCKLIGEPVPMPDGVVAVAAIMDWNEFEWLNISKKPMMMRWFTQDQSIQAGERLQRPEVYLQP